MPWVDTAHTSLEEFKGRQLVQGRRPTDVMEDVHQIQAIDKANAGEVTPLGALGNQRKLEKQALEQPQLPQDQRSSGWQSKPTATTQPGPWGPIGDKFVNAVSSVIEPIQRGLQTYEERIAKPFRKTMFKEDPLETLATQRPGPESSGYEQGYHALKELGVGILSDPLTPVFGVLGVGGRIRPPSPVQSPGSPAGPVTAPVITAEPKPLSSGPSSQISTPQRPSITDLAREHQEKMLQGEPGSAGQTSQGNPVLGQGLEPRGVQPMVEQLPTGSVSRPLTQEEVPLSHYQGPSLSTNPSGSLIRVKPPQETAASSRGPVVENQPTLPISRNTLPTSSDLIPESKMLHGAPLELPPKPPLLSAEDMLAQRLEKQSLLHEQYRRDLDYKNSQQAELPTLPADPVVDTPGPRQPPQAGPASGPVEFFGSIPPQLAKPLPSVRQRVLSGAYDLLDNMGYYTKRLADIYRYSGDYSEQGTIHNFQDYIKLVQGVVKKPGLVARIAQKYGETESGTLASKLDPFLNPTAKDLGLTQKQIDAIYELNEAHGDISKISQAAKDRLPINDPVVQHIHQEGWKIATGRASNEPSIQQYASIYDPLTGESTKVGPPTPFNPHLPIDMKTKVRLSDEMLKKFYQRGNYEDKGYSFTTFKDQFKKWWYTDDPTIQMRKFSGVDYKRYLDIMDDAKTHNRTAAESARYYGYETDPLRLLVRYNQGALKRAKMLEYSSEMQKIFDTLGEHYGQGSDTYKWIETVHSRTQGIGLREDLLKELNWFGKMQSIMYPSWLKFSWLQNITLQPTYGVMHTSPTAVAKALWQHYGSKVGLNDSQIAELSRRSGANFPSFFAKYNRPDGILSQYNKTANEANLFALSDNGTRNFTGMVAIPHIESVAKNLWRQPTEAKWKGLLQEANINPDELLGRMKQNSGKGLMDGDTPQVPQEYLLRGAQVISNRAMGRTGIQALPLWATGDTVAHKAMLMLQRQLWSNTAAVHRLIFNAPTMGEGLKRSLILLTGAVVGGHIYQAIKNWINGRNPGDPGITLKQAFNKLGIKGERQQQEEAYFTKALLNGIGTFNSNLMLAGLNMLSGNINAGSLPLTPAASSFTEDILKDIMHGKAGKAGMRLQPLPIPPGLYKDKPKQQGGMSLPQMPKVGWQ